MNAALYSIGVINSDSKLSGVLEWEQEFLSQHGFSLVFCSSKDQTFEVLNYSIPDLVVINLSDPDLQVTEILEEIGSDPWLHGFGLIGLYDKKRDTENKLLEELRSYNLVGLVEFNDISTNLLKVLKIIAQNKQMVFQSSLLESLQGCMSGSFEIANDPFAVTCYANLLAISLYRQGMLDDRLKLSMQFALQELLMNAIEHGNCAISYDEKTEYLENGGSIDQLIRDKCQDPTIGMRTTTFRYDVNPQKSLFVITDQGDGFDWRAQMKSSEDQDLWSLHGRGIAMTKQSFASISYNEKGNEVSFEVPHIYPPQGMDPGAFMEQEICRVKAGDVIFSQGERSDFLYYISSGHYGVYQGDKKVGHITASDMFMGEMAFLLGSQRSATVKAEEDGKLIRISRSGFVRTIKRYPHYGVFLSKLLAKKLACLNDALANEDQQEA